MQFKFLEPMSPLYFPSSVSSPSILKFHCLFLTLLSSNGQDSEEGKNLDYTEGRNAASCTLSGSQKGMSVAVTCSDFGNARTKHKLPLLLFVHSSSLEGVHGAAQAGKLSARRGQQLVGLLLKDQLSRLVRFCVAFC